MPIVIGLAAAMALFGIAWKTNFLGLGDTFKTLFLFTVSIFKIAGALAYLLSGLFFVVQSVKLVGYVFLDIGYRIRQWWDDLDQSGSKVTAGLKKNVQSMINPFVRFWNYLNYMADAILGIGEAGHRMDVDLHVAAHNLVGAFLAPLDSIATIGDFLGTYLLDPLLSGIELVGDLFSSFSEFAGLGNLPIIGKFFRDKEVIPGSVPAPKSSVLPLTTKPGLDGGYPFNPSGNLPAPSGFVGPMDTRPKPVLMDAIAKPFADAIAPQLEAATVLAAKEIEYPRGRTPNGLTGSDFGLAARTPNGLTQAGMGRAGRTPNGLDGVYGAESASSMTGKAITSYQAQSSVEKLQRDVGAVIASIQAKAIAAGTTALNYLADIPAKVIPQKWQGLYKNVVRSIGDVAKGAVNLANRAAASIGPIFNTMKTQWQSLSMMTAPGQMPSFGNFVSLITPQIDQLKEAGAEIMNASVYLLANSADALLNVNFDQFKQGLLDYGASFKTVAGLVIGSFANMTLSAVVFGAFSVFSFSPVLAIMGLVGIAAFLLATNFLGLRSIIVGVTKVAYGMMQIVYGLIMGLREVIGGVLGIIEGLFWALQGNFDLLMIGWERVCNGIKIIALGFAEGIKSIFSGVGDFIKGIFEAMAQTVNTIFGLMGADGNLFSDVIRGIGSTVQTTADLIATAVTSPMEAWKKFLGILESITNRIRGINKKTEETEAASVGQSIKHSAFGKYVRAMKMRVTGEADSLQAGKAQADFNSNLETGGKSIPG